MKRKYFFILIFPILMLCNCNNHSILYEEGDVVTFGNNKVVLLIDLSTGTYDIKSLVKYGFVVQGAGLRMNDFKASDEDYEVSYVHTSIKDEFGEGRELALNFESKDRPSFSFKFSLYDNKELIGISSSFINNTSDTIHLKEIYPMENAILFQDVDFPQNFSMVDGFSGGEPLEYGRRMYSPLTSEYALKSRNNILMTFGKGTDRSTLVMGGLSYHDFEKFASIEQSRRIELSKGPDGKQSLLAYLNLPDDIRDGQDNGTVLELSGEVTKRTWDNNEFRCTETATSASGKGKIVISASNIDPDGKYYLGLSWWRGMRHGNRKDHRQSVICEYSDRGKIRIKYLIKDELLPRFDGMLKEDVQQAELPIPSEVIAAGEFKIIVEKTPDDYENSANDPNAYLSEIWLRDGSCEALLPKALTDINKCERPRRELIANLFASDPVGKRVDPGETYVCPDRFYIDPVTSDPFIALENYGKAVSRGQGIELSMYDFPTVCLWYAEVDVYGGSHAENTTLGAVNEMEIIRDKGFLNFSRAAVRLVPDSYLPDNQQGWWDDEHWQMEETDRNASENGRYVEPYETSEKWGKAVTDLGGIPLTYFQAGFRSEDYAEAFPGHMLFNEALRWRGTPQKDPGDLFTSWNRTWTRNRAVWGYDYTDPGFLDHLKGVYDNLATGGIRGLMFDYPGYAWSYAGGFEDPYATAANAYRNIFRMPFEGLGPGSYVHERNMERGTDISIGYVASMRTENDTDKMDATTVTRCGMRWYKNRVLYNQDTDSKNIARLQENRDDVRAVLTMAYVTTGRLLLANSFDQFTDETLSDITRTFPYHMENKSARPADAFVNDVPMVYDFKINDNWHQLTFYNPDFNNNKKISISLAGRPVDGALAVDPGALYHVYDFWNDKYIGVVAGSKRLEQELRPGEARMMSVRKVEKHPQVISTNRHIMQGYLDMRDVEWNGWKKELSGVSKVVGGDPYVITIASNGIEYNEILLSGASDMTIENLESGLIKLTLESDENGEMEWWVRFK